MTGMCAELVVLLDPLGHLQPGDLRKLDVHEDQVGLVLAGKVDRLEAVARLDDIVADPFQEIVEELHVELVVFHDQHGLGHCGLGSGSRRARPRAGPRPCRTHQYAAIRERKTNAIAAGERNPLKRNAVLNPPGPALPSQP